MRRLIFIPSLVAALLSARPDLSAALPDDPHPPADKSGYSLFNPVPAAAMRAMSTDRPDTTESAYTVDAGHFQLEMSFFDFTRDHEGTVKFDAWSFGQFNFKAGLCNHTDLQVMFDAYTHERTIDSGIESNQSGFSDVTVRLKTNLWGNDGGATALALMPFVKIPTNVELSNGEWEGGLIVPLAVSLTDRIGLGLMAEMDIVDNPNTGCSQTVEWVHTATVGVGLSDELGMYFELVGIAGTAADYQALFDTGLTFGLSDNMVIDTGLRIGLNGAAPDFGVFAGMSIRY